MNIETSGRSQQSLASLDEQRRGSRLEYSSLPWAGRQARDPGEEG